MQDFRLSGEKSIILFIGDAMGTAYRDLSRIVAQSTNNRFREGFFDELQEMDKMPVTGMAMTYSSINRSMCSALSMLPSRMRRSTCATSSRSPA